MGSTTDEEVANEFHAIQLLTVEQHPNIIEVLRLDRFPNGSFVFIDMELCDFSLFEVLEAVAVVDAVHTDGLSRADMVVNIMGQIMTAVDYIHSKGVVHRDLKPQNGSSSD